LFLPHIKREVVEARKGGFQFDTIGFKLVALTFGCIEVVLDKGQEDGPLSHALQCLPLGGTELEQIHFDFFYSSLAGAAYEDRND
jgi:hypothetical protein